MLEKSYFLEEIPASGELKKRVLCVHGLNQNPEALKFFLKELSYHGVQVFLLHLPGHNKSFKGEEVQFSEISEAYTESYGLITREHGKIDVFIGYSFGGLIGAYHFEECPFEKSILLAPAVRLKGITHGIKLILPFFKSIYSIPFVNKEYERKYRFHQKGVPSSVYKSFFQYYECFHKKNESFFKKSKGLVFCHKGDELIDYKKLKAWTQEKEHWKFLTLSNEKAVFKKYNHLCFDPTVLGDDQFKDLVQKSLNFLIN